MEEQQENKPENSNQKGIVGAIIIAGVLIAGAILLKGGSLPARNPGAQNNGIPVTMATLAPVNMTEDRVLGEEEAKVTVVMYEDFQCPFCGKFHTDSEKPIRDTYVQNGNVNLVYRDFAFLGPESQKAAEAARCAGNQGRFWEYHDYLFEHQNGENQGSFSDPNLKSFAKTLGFLDTASFNQCLDSGKYAQAVADSKAEGANAGVTGTPKGFILRDGKIVSTIDGAEPFVQVKQKIDNALK